MTAPPPQDGRLRTGDHILRIGATPTAGLSSDQVVRVLQGCGSTVTMVIARDPRSPGHAPTPAPLPPSSAPVSTPRRRFTNVCLDNICGYLVELQSLSPNSALQQTIGNFKALQSKLQKVH